MKSRVTERGQITIPKRLRERLGIRPGQIMEFEDDDGKLVATKVNERDPVDDVYGILGDPGSTDEFMDEIRGAPDVV